MSEKEKDEEKEEAEEGRVCIGKRRMIRRKRVGLKKAWLVGEEKGMT